MPRNNIPLDTTGLPGLDRALTGLLAGDNIVWNLETPDPYPLLARPFAEAARRDGRDLLYFRFGAHPRLLPEGFCEEIAPDPARECHCPPQHRKLDFPIELYRFQPICFSGRKAKNSGNS